MYTLVLLRHGQSEWNKENKFTGWANVDLTPLGEKQARTAGEEMKRAGLVFDIAFCSKLKRARRTLELALRESGQNPPTIYASELNERHYGGLQGLDKKETLENFGLKQFKLWHRGYEAELPLESEEDHKKLAAELGLEGISEKEIPYRENLKDVERRLMPFFQKSISNEITSGKRVLIVAHGNTFRALIKNLENLSSKEVESVEVEIGQPLLCTLDQNLKLIQKKYL